MLGGPRAYLVWGVALLAYVAAIFHRSSLGVAGIIATDRLGASAALLGVLSLVQLAVYAGMQIPVGVLLDRWGARRLLAGGSGLMALGQVILAHAHDVPTAVLARGVLGGGDAMTFISVLRLVAMWFPARRNPLVVQLTAQIGALGAVISSYPLVAALRGPGWTATFTVAGLVSLGLGVLVVLVVRDAPSAAMVASRPRLRAEDVRHQLVDAWSEPGTRLGFWTHLVTQFSANVFGLLWGFPFLVIAEGRSDSQAAGLLTGMTLTGIVIGPLLGTLVARHPFHRSWLVLGIIGLTASSWLVVLLWPGHAPLGILIALMVVLGINGPGSMIGLDYARTFNPAHRAGSASGMVNIGGFVATLSVVLVIGVIVTSVSGAGDYSAGALHWAFAVQFPVWALGAVQVVRMRERSRVRLAERDPEAYAALRRGVAGPPPS